MTHYEVIVIGSGVAGSAAAYQLASHRQVLLLEQHEFLHLHGSSHGGSRIFRHAYEDARYVRLAVAADERWRALERDAGERLLYRTGGVDIGKADNPELASIERALSAAGRPVEQLEAGQVRKRFPAFHLSDDQVALWQEDAGILPATRCLNAMQRLAVARGASLQAGETVREIHPAANHLEIVTSRRRYAADHLVMTTGAWLGELLPYALPLFVEQQQVLYLRVERGVDFLPEAFPVFINRDSNVYGFPLFDHPTAVKVSDHSGAPTIRLEDRSYQLDEARADATIRQLRGFLPGVTKELVSFQTCLYTKTPDEHFVIGRHPEHPNLIFAGGFSGHGFKFGPLLGEILMELVLAGKSKHDLELFNPGRFRS